MQIRDLIAELQRFPETEEVFCQVTVNHARQFFGCCDEASELRVERVERLPGQGVLLELEPEY